MLEELKQLKQEIMEKCDQVSTTKELNEIRVEYLGKKGPIQAMSSKWVVYLLRRKKSLDVL